MPRISNTTNAQTKFLRAFRTSPSGPAPQDWPSPAILRRWLRSPYFCRALESIQQTNRFQTDFHLSTAAAQAAAALTAPDSADPDFPALSERSESKGALFNALSILRLYHVRQRFTNNDNKPSPHDFDLDPTTGLKILRFLRSCDRSLKLSEIWPLLFTVDHRIETFWTHQEFFSDEQPKFLAEEHQ